MKSRNLLGVAVIALVGALAVPQNLSAQEPDAGNRQHHKYKLIDMGTFGGPGGGISNPSSPTLNRRGALVGISDTSETDPFYPNCFLDCYVNNGWIWQNGVLTQLSSLPGGASNFAAAINDRGQIAGESQNGDIDQLTGWPEADAVLWHEGHIRSLGTLGGNQSNAYAVNNRGQVVGAALNTTSDPFANNPLLSCIFDPYAEGCFTFPGTFLFAPAATETRAFFWTREQGMQDLGTLGGPDSAAWLINDRGQITGESFTSFTPNQSSGVPTIDPFFWSAKEKKLIDLGGLGGTFGAPTSMNRWGQVVGISNPPGDTTEHPFLWPGKDGKMQDLGTFFGPSGFGFPTWINDAGEIVGTASNTDGTSLVAFLWKNGRLINLGTLGTDDTSLAYSINSSGQVVGFSRDSSTGNATGFLWENHGPMVDLNTLVPPDTTMTVTLGIVIGDRGEIGCLGLDPGDLHEHACFLIPCDDGHPGVEGCDYSLVDVAAVANAREARMAQAPSKATKHDIPSLLQDRLGAWKKARPSLVPNGTEGSER